MNTHEDPIDWGSIRIRYITIMMTNYSPMEVVEIMKRADRARRLDLLDYNQVTGPEDTEWWNKRRKGE